MWHRQDGKEVEDEKIEKIGKGKPNVSSHA